MFSNIAYLSFAKKLQTIMNKYIFAFITMIFMTALIAAQDRVKIEPDQSYLVLSTKKLKTMESELNEVSAQGFRVLYGAPTTAYDIAVLLKRLDDTESAPYTYKVLATSLIKTMEKELNENAARLSVGAAHDCL